MQNATTLMSNELDQILIYDLGFCYLMMLDFEHASYYFSKLELPFFFLYKLIFYKD
jgi:hypothetical protein